MLRQPTCYAQQKASKGVSRLFKMLNILLLEATLQKLISLMVSPSGAPRRDLFCTADSFARRLANLAGTLCETHGHGRLTCKGYKQSAFRRQSCRGTQDM